MAELNATGHLAYVSEASTLHNSLLLHDDADSLTFTFQPSMHTDRVEVLVEHPLLAATTWEDGLRISKLNLDSRFRKMEKAPGSIYFHTDLLLTMVAHNSRVVFYMTSLMFLFGAMVKMFCRMSTLEQRQIRVDMPWMVIMQSIFQRDLCMAGFASEHGACLTSHPLSISMLNILQK